MPGPIPSSLSPADLFSEGPTSGPGGISPAPGRPELTEALLDRAAFTPGTFVADVGCGRGASVSALLKRGILGVGIDADEATLKCACERFAGACFLPGEAGRLPFENEALDGLVAECSLSLMAERPRVLADWLRVLRPGGRLAVSDVYGRPGRPERVGSDAAVFATWRQVAGDLLAAGFLVRWFEDRSDVFANWTARFGFAVGSLEALWGGGCAVTADRLRTAHPGYYIAIADKPGSSGFGEGTFS